MYFYWFIIHGIDQRNFLEYLAMPISFYVILFQVKIFKMILELFLVAAALLLYAFLKDRKPPNMPPGEYRYLLFKCLIWLK